MHQFKGFPTKKQIFLWRNDFISDFWRSCFIVCCMFGLLNPELLPDITSFRTLSWHNAASKSELVETSFTKTSVCVKKIPNNLYLSAVHPLSCVRCRVRDSPRLLDTSWIWPFNSMWSADVMQSYSTSSPTGPACDGASLIRLASKIMCQVFDYEYVMGDSQRILFLQRFYIRREL